MFSDFDAKRREDGGRGRSAVSLLLAGGVFALLAIAIGAAVATAHQIVQREREVEVEFAQLEEAAPEPEPEPEPEPPPPSDRPPPAPAAVVDGPPASIPDVRPEEREGALTEAENTGPLDGTYGGEEGGTGTGPAPEPIAPAPPAPPPGPPRPPRTPPQQERVEVSPPRRLGGCDTPDRPDALEGATAETIRIRVRVVVGADGRVMRATVTDGHDLVPEETVLSCVRTRLYEPATLEGTPVPYVFTYVFTFRPDVL